MINTAPSAALRCYVIRRKISIRCKFSNIYKIYKHINLCNLTEKYKKETYPEGPIIRLANRWVRQLYFFKEKSLIF